MLSEAEANIARERAASQQADIDRARLAAIVESSDDAIVSKTLDGVITSWNPGAERMFGWTAAEAVGRHITLIIPKERHGEEADVLAALRRGERVDHFETVRVAKDGHLLSVSLTVSPIRDATGRVVGASKIARDITARQQGELDRARLGAIVESSDDAIIGKTLAGFITSWNPSAERIFGWTAAEAVGCHISLIVPEERRVEEAEVLARIARGERVQHFDTVRVTKDGRFLDVSLTVSPIRDGGGRIVGASKIARDVSGRRRLEEEREQLLAREQRARAEAEALNRTKDEFLATMSHELRTPLNAIFGWARMLQSSTMDETTQARALDAIVRSASAQSRLVEDLLDLSRIVSGRMRLELEPYDMRAVIEAALDTVRPAAAAKGIALETRFDPAVPVMTGAPARLQQVVWNLLMNAVKFTPAGGRVQVTLRPWGEGVEILVVDDGEGISAEALPYIFDRFRQEDSSTTRRYGGLGLGLALVRHLVELHGGTVHALSAGKRQGATFTVRLPATMAVKLDHEPPVTADTPAVPHPRLLRGVRVLVVDDRDDALELTALMLRGEGAEVKTATAARRAYEIVEGWRPDVLVSDLAMPGADGFMLLHGLRAVLAAQGAPLPAVALSAYGTAENRLQATDAGFDVYLTKPVDPQKFAEAVAGLVRRAR
ncbi:MAG TPA: PAS domain S-box protein [Methylomirabilota bacterium]|nr:PAS domain S-box protein [Methylomirabilota bacterium]